MEAGAFRDGMVVYSADGKKLGKIVEHDDDSLVIEKGLFFKEDYKIGLEHVDRVQGDEAWLDVDHDAIEAEREEEAPPARGADAAATGVTGMAAASAAAGDAGPPAAPPPEAAQGPEAEAQAQEEEIGAVLEEEEVVIIAGPETSADAELSTPGAPERDPDKRG